LNYTVTSSLDFILKLLYYIYISNLMGGKAKPTKHTAKEIARKVDLKHTNRK